MLETIAKLYLLIGTLSAVLLIAALIADWLEGQEWFRRWYWRNFR